MEIYTASNGVALEIAPEGHIIIPPVTTGLGELTQQALREFFQYERDEELGRWRWPENPEWIVYALRPGFSAYNGADLLVVNEVHGASMEYVRALDDGTEYVDADERAAKAARAYFEAHPEPKPWKDAKPGEVWVLTTDSEGGEHAWFVDPDYSGGRFVFVGGLSNIPLDHPDITAARRVWPESSDD